MPKKSIVFEKQSKYQKIQLARQRGGLMLLLNGSPQVHSTEERLYHEAFATLPLMLAKSVRSVLILGGGDGLALREVLRFADVKRVTLVELDAEVVKLCSSNPEWRQMTGDSLRDPRVEVVIGDGIEYMVNTRKKFDVIIHDLEDEFTTQPEPLSVDLYQRFYFAIGKKLKPGGVWVTIVFDGENDLMLREIYASYRENLPPVVQAEFMRKRGVIARTAVLLRTIFPTVRQWPIDFPVLGKHCNFYMSDAPLNKIQRRPTGVLEHIGARLPKELTG